MLQTELSRKIESAKELEKKGKHKEASKKYIEASSIYRRIAILAPREKAEGLFSAADQYEKVAKIVNQAKDLKKIEKTDPEIFEESVSNLIVSQKPDTTWDKIGGLEETKSILKEAIILPFIKDKPPFVKSQRTILLYGPPGTGKSLLAKASSNTLGATFFEARVSTLLSKYFGESPKLVNALFDKARKMQPSVIFIDEIDSVAVQRKGDSSEATRRVLAELLTQIDGFSTQGNDMVLIMAATNKPWDLDEAAISRFIRKIYVPLPDEKSRKQIFAIHLEGAQIDNSSVYRELSARTKGFSGRDIKSVCMEAISRMVRDMNPDLESLDSKQIEHDSLRSRYLSLRDFDAALEKIKPSATQKDLDQYENWKKEFGG